VIHNTIHPFIFFLWLSGLVSLPIAMFSWRRGTAVSRPFALSMLAVAFWSITYSFELLNHDLDAILFWINVEYLFILTIPVCLFIFASRYTGRDQWLTPTAIGGLLVVPTIVLLLVWTNPRHGLYYTTVALIERDGLTLLSSNPGIGYWTSTAYAYTLIFGSVYFSFLAARSSLPPYRFQVFIILAGIIIPWASNMAYNFVLRPSSSLDLTPIAFTATGIVVLLGLYRYQFIELMPVARNKLVETMEDGWIVINQNNQLVDLNYTAQVVLGVDRRGSIGQPLQQLLPDRDILLAHLTNQANTSTEICLPVDREERYFDIRQTVLLEENGRLNGRLIVLRDISERKDAEIALQQLSNNLEREVVHRTAEIKAEKEKVETVLRSVNEGMALTDETLRVQYANDEFARFTHRPKDALIGVTIADAILGQLDEAQQTLLENVLISGQLWQTETVERLESGAICICEVTAIPVRNGNGRFSGAVWTLQDVSEKRKLEQARNQFVANISHEFRTPLANVRLYTTLLEQLALPPKAQEYARVLETQTIRLEHLTQRILTIARLDSMNTLADAQPIDLRRILTPIVRQFEERAVSAQITFKTLTGERPLPIISGHVVYLHQAVVELVENAFTFTPPNGRVTLEITQDTTERLGWTRISVTDSGPGILPEEQPNVFNRFFRGSLAASGNTPGVGLGLSIVWEIMRLHGGSVTCECCEGTGCRVSLWLPPAAA
jgi:PAS domain S-box-containing protein